MHEVDVKQETEARGNTIGPGTLAKAGSLAPCGDAGASPEWKTPQIQPLFDHPHTEKTLSEKSLPESHECQALGSP